MGILTKNSSEKSNAPHMPGVPLPLGLNIDRCITAGKKKTLACKAQQGEIHDAEKANRRKWLRVYFHKASELWRLSDHDNTNETSNCCHGKHHRSSRRSSR